MQGPPPRGQRRLGCTGTTPHHASALAVAGAHASVARAGWAQQRQHRPRFHSPLPAAAFPSLPARSSVDRFNAVVSYSRGVSPWD